MKFKWRTLVFILGMVLVVILLMDLSSRLERMDRLDSQLESVAAEATSVMATQVGLITQVAYATSDAAVDQWAYEDGKWIKPGEHLVEIVPVGTPAAPTATAPGSGEEDVPKWRIWWELFFGDQP
jgi:uncharacterized protein (DUF2147 family)